MFKQMAISAPIAMVVIFLLMLFFFRKFVLVISPMIVALVCTVITMGLLVVTGSTVHIMSSMIPIFIMPIAVLDAVHILSEFFDRYPESHDRESAMTGVMDTLFVPMLYTSITTAVGFGALALVPIPPVQVFGIFVAFGVLMAWIWTVTFIPAFVSLISPKRLENFGAKASEEGDGKAPLMERVLGGVGRGTYRYAKVILLAVVVLTIVAGYGITQIRINDNPIRWFTKDHPIRVADKVLNEHFGGTYMAYLTLTPEQRELDLPTFSMQLVARLNSVAKDADDIEAIDSVVRELRQQAQTMAKSVGSPAKLLDELELYADTRLFEAPREQTDAWDRMMTFLASESGRLQLFKQPEVLKFMEDLRAHLLDTGIVGKVNALPDIVKTVNRELFSGEEPDFRIPDSSSGVAQTLLQYQNSHRPQDLWHFVTPDYRQAVLWLQLKSGDNRDMEAVVHSVNEYMESANVPLEGHLDHRWFGLTYINVIWQEKMVAGMLRAFLGSFLIVFVMMTILYRSALWGMLSMVPLTVTIALIYGMIGLIGKDYDMPVAVLSSLSLGLAIDYAIHFLSRSRAMYLQHGSWRSTAGPVFDEPARAITRNAIVIGVGFLPLLAAPLMPYKTVGVFIAAILFAAGLASLLILPSLITLLEPLLFPRSRKCCLVCNCVTCIITSVAAVVAVIVNVGYLLTVGWTVLSWASLLLVLVLSQACYFISKTKLCRTVVPMTTEDAESTNSANQPQKGDEPS
ncbi:MAG: efflux RND transporter permease subunit [bacterium]